jgi:hypothetical protein
MNFSMLDSSLDQAAQRTATTEIESITSPPGAEAGRGEAELCGHGRSELSMTSCGQQWRAPAAGVLCDWWNIEAACLIERATEVK